MNLLLSVGKQSTAMSLLKLMFASGKRVDYLFRIGQRSFEMVVKLSPTHTYVRNAKTVTHLNFCEIEMHFDTISFNAIFKRNNAMCATERIKQKQYRIVCFMKCSKRVWKIVCRSLYGLHAFSSFIMTIVFQWHRKSSTENKMRNLNSVECICPHF